MRSILWCSLAVTLLPLAIASIVKSQSAPILTDVLDKKDPLNPSVLQRSQSEQLQPMVGELGGVREKKKKSKGPKELTPLEVEQTFAMLDNAPQFAYEECPLVPQSLLAYVMCKLNQFRPADPDDAAFFDKLTIYLPNEKDQCANFPQYLDPVDAGRSMTCAGVLGDKDVGEVNQGFAAVEFAGASCEITKISRQPDADASGKVARHRGIVHRLVLIALASMAKSPISSSEDDVAFTDEQYAFDGTGCAQVCFAATNPQEKHAMLAFRFQQQPDATCKLGVGAIHACMCRDMESEANRGIFYRDVDALLKETVTHRPHRRDWLSSKKAFVPPKLPVV